MVYTEEQRQEIADNNPDMTTDELIQEIIKVETFDEILEEIYKYHDAKE